jgi:hypothetical protein
MTTKMKPQAWHQRPRMNRLASVLYPSLADPQAQREMEYYAKSEGKLSPMQAKARGFKDQAKPEEPRRTNLRWFETK